MNDDLAGFIVAVIFLIFLGIGALIMNPISCSAKFPDNQTSWGPIQGCLVKTEKGWIPAANYRVM